MSGVAPDFDGFRDAQVRLRENFGKDLTFYTPGATTYPPGTPLNEDGRPYDPTIQPSASGVTTQTVRVSVVSRPIGRSRGGMSAPISDEALGWVEAGDIVLIVDPEKLPPIKDATEVDYDGARWVIRTRDKDSLGPVDRYLLFCARKGAS